MFERSSHQRTPVSRAEISEARFKRFVRDLSVYERRMIFDETLNNFLDMYSAWMKTHEPWLKIRLVTLAFELNELDPTFQCDLAFVE